MGDFLLQSKERLDKDYRGCCCWEIGSGVGVTAVAAAVTGVFETVYATDLGDNLEILRENVEGNRALWNSLGSESNVSVSECDVTRSHLPEDLDEVSDAIGVVLGADVVYDNDVTLGIVRALKNLLRKKPLRRRLLLFSIERRYVLCYVM